MKLSPYDHIGNIGASEREDHFHYARSLITMANSFPYQEVGSHTFSHYYCFAEGQDEEDFREDLKAAIRAAEKNNIRLVSLVVDRQR